MTNQPDMAAVADGLPTKAAKIRALDAAGYPRADIARFLGIRYQHVRNVLLQGTPKSPRAADRARSTDRVEVKIGPGGRIVIPAAFREAMEAGEGDTLVAVIDGDGVVRLTSAATALRMARRIVSEAIPADVSLSDSLIEDRRREAAREAGPGIG
ncbi:MAG: AbrB/MazE/SpoVT family DNA-binding domain-containing protein [Defluviicoccus sp.]|nr:AbrB/MazE/SpoVT family DNA-binding domain-containing protein [Defluviicoccus sp.]